MRLTGRTAIVTGAGFGIGRASAVLIANEGAFVALVDRDGAGLQETLAAIEGAKGEASVHVGDVSEADFAQTVVGNVMARRGRLDVLMTAAGFSCGGTVLTTDPADWDAVFRTNVGGTWLWSRAAVPEMQRQGRGSIITLASQLAIAGGRSNSAYIAAKGAIISLNSDHGEPTFTALLIALVSAVPLGVLAALKPGSAIDHGVRFFCALGVCVPTFVSGLLLIYVFYYLFGLAPDPTGRVDIFASLPPSRTGFLLIDFLLAGDFAGWRAAFRQLILPALSMALFVVAPLARITRASMLVSLGSDFVRTAKSMGLPWWKIVVTYALRNAILPVITIAGIVFSTMLGANVLVEKVFSWPGVASYALDALLSSDYAPVQGFVLLMASVFVIVNLLVDILYGIADPRVTIG